MKDIQGSEKMDDVDAVLEYNAKAVYHPLRCADGMALNNIQFAQKQCIREIPL